MFILEEKVFSIEQKINTEAEIQSVQNKTKKWIEKYAKKRKQEGK